MPTKKKTVTKKPVAKKKTVAKKAAPKKLVNIIGIARDHSGSMHNLAESARNDFNKTIASLRSASKENNVGTQISVAEFGSSITIKENDTNIDSVQNLSYYPTPGQSTRLFDSVITLINNLQASKEAKNPDASFLIMAITDGQDNASTTSGALLRTKIQELQATDRWTFVFRVPKGYKQFLVNYGIPEDNILEWDLSSRGIEVASAQSTAAFSNFYASRTRGVTSTNKFYTDLSNVKITEVKQSLEDISNEIETIRVKSENDGMQIRDLVEKELGVTYQKGAAFYQLSKTEKVQEYKEICIKDKKKATVYSGPAARNLLGLPSSGEIKLSPGDHGNYHIFVQSTSVNRKVESNTSVLYWPKATKRV